MPRLLPFLGLLLAASTACAHAAPETLGNAASPYRDLSKLPVGTIVHLRTGRTVDRATLFDHLARQQVVYVGETHDNPDAHRVQFEILQALAARHPDLAVGLEMVPRDRQALLDQWVAGELKEKAFAREWTALWSTGYRAYAEILRFCRDRRIPLIALNAPRALVHAVAQKGLDGLSEEERAQLPKGLDADDPYHRAKTKALFSGHSKAHTPDFDRFYPAQLLWDEAMAEAGAQYLERHPGAHLLILAGGYHVEQGVGVPRRLFRRLPVPFATVLPITPKVPKEKKDRLMKVKRMPEIPLLLADFVWAVPYGDLPGVKLGVMVGRTSGEGQRLAIDQVLDGTPAAKAGLKAGDRIVAVAGKPVSDLFDLRWALGALHPGDTTEVTVEHDGVRRTVRVTF
ncbi:MAG: PDZ domain-containing protein [Nitrospirae bacterium]|nr:MAG: PDZ domain-containing protein [Nitrospirota bacterium]